MSITSLAAEVAYLRQELEDALEGGAMAFQDSIELGLQKNAESSQADKWYERHAECEEAYIELLENAEDLFNQTLEIGAGTSVVEWRSLADNFGHRVDSTVEGPRSSEYGAPSVMLARIAEYWTTLFKRTVTPEMVAQAYILGKIARGMTNLTPDSVLDIAGYAKIIAESKAEDERKQQRAKFGWQV